MECAEVNGTRLGNAGTHTNNVMHVEETICGQYARTEVGRLQMGNDRQARRAKAET